MRNGVSPPVVAVEVESPPCR